MRVDYAEAQGRDGISTRRVRHIELAEEVKVLEPLSLKSTRRYRMNSRILSPCLRAASLLIVIAGIFCTLFAQEYRGKVQGIVTDPSQAAVAGAKVTLRNVNTGIEVAKTT